MSDESFDLVVVGPSPAGASAAAAAGLMGKRVILVEATAKLGGSGINTGTLPSKSRRETALELSGWRSRRLYGVDRNELTAASVTHLAAHPSELVPLAQEHAAGR